MEEAILWAERLKEVPSICIRSIKYGRYKSAEFRYLENERDFVEYIWPQMVSADKQEDVTSFREGRKPGGKGLKILGRSYRAKRDPWTQAR